MDFDSDEPAEQLPGPTVRELDAFAGLGYKEASVLQTLRRHSLRGRGAFREDEYHSVHNILDVGGNGLGFSYELVHWETLDKGFKSHFGAVLYSPELHGIINGLVEKGLVRRVSDDPIKIEYVKPA